MIILNNVYKYYDDICALDNISLNIPSGSICGVVGTNGAGKTTLLKLIAAVMAQDKGEVLVEGQRIYDNPCVKENVFFIPDRPGYLDGFNIRDTAKFYKGIYHNWDHERYINLCRMYNMDENMKINRMSKGQRLQSAFIMALSTMPKLMIMDEPFNGLDIIQRKRIKSLLIDEVADRNMTVLVSSHNVREMDDFCDNIVMIHQSELVEQMDIESMLSMIYKIHIGFKDTNKNYIEELKTKLNIIYSKQRDSSFTLIVKGDKNRIGDLLHEQHPAVLDIFPLTLEEIFYYELGGARS